MTTELGVINKNAPPPLDDVFAFLSVCVHGMAMLCMPIGPPPPSDLLERAGIRDDGHA